MINHEKRTREANKQHKKAHFEKDKKYSQQLKSNINKHSKIVSKLQLDFTDILSKSEAKLHVTTERYQTMKRDYDSVLDSIRINHHASLRKIQIVHAQQIQKKNEMVKRMWNDAEGTREMLCKMLHEMNESRRTIKFASASADKTTALSKKAGKRVSILFKKLQTSTSLINELKDEINDKTRTINDLEKKVGEYDEVIDWM